MGGIVPRQVGLGCIRKLAEVSVFSFLLLLDLKP